MELKPDFKPVERAEVAPHKPVSKKEGDKPENSLSPGIFEKALPKTDSAKTASAPIVHAKALQAPTSGAPKPNVPRQTEEYEYPMPLPSDTAAFMGRANRREAVIQSLKSERTTYDYDQEAMRFNFAKNFFNDKRIPEECQCFSQQDALSQMKSNPNLKFVVWPDTKTGQFGLLVRNNHYNRNRLKCFLLNLPDFTKLLNALEKEKVITLGQHDAGYFYLPSINWSEEFEKIYHHKQQ